MIKLIVSDIDGTLVPEGNTDLNPEYLEVIKKLTEKGIVFAAAMPAALMRYFSLSVKESITCRTMEPVLKKMEKKRGRCIFRQRSFANFCMKPGKWKGAM